MNSMPYGANPVLIRIRDADAAQDEVAETLRELVGELEDRAGCRAVQLTVEGRHNVAAADLVQARQQAHLAFHHVADTVDAGEFVDLAADRLMIDNVALGRDE